ncbi:MAG: carbohydrate-binding protein, partial [Pseudomonadota bacterium]
MGKWKLALLCGVAIGTLQPAAIGQANSGNFTPDITLFDDNASSGAGVWNNSGSATIVGDPAGRAGSALRINSIPYGQSGLLVQRTLSPDQQYLQFEYYRPSGNAGELTLRHGGSWAAMALNGSNNQHWTVNGQPGPSSMGQLAESTWHTVQVDLAGLGITIFQAIGMKGGGGGATNYFDNVLLGTLGGSTPPPPTNTAPVSGGVPSQTVTTGQAITTINLNDHFSDAEGDTLTYRFGTQPAAGLTISGNTLSGSVTTVGTHAFTIIANDGTDDSAAISFALTVEEQASPPPAAGQTPYGGTAPIISTTTQTIIEPQTFDEGGQGIAYNDSPGRSGGNAFRTETDVEVHSNKTIGWIAAGEWLEYTINVGAAGTYDLNFITSSPFGTSFSASFTQNGATYENATFTVPNTGAWTSYAPTSTARVTLQAGTQVLRVSFDNGNLDLGNIQFQPVQATPPTGDPQLGVELITNGDFQNHPPLTSNGSRPAGTGLWDLFTSIEGWTADAGHVEIQNASFLFTPGQNSSNR